MYPSNLNRGRCYTVEPIIRRMWVSQQMATSPRKSCNTVLCSRGFDQGVRWCSTPTTAARRIRREPKRGHGIHTDCHRRGWTPSNLRPSTCLLFFTRPAQRLYQYLVHLRSFFTHRKQALEQTGASTAVRALFTLALANGVARRFFYYVILRKKCSWLLFLICRALKRSMTARGAFVCRRR